jgi:hypothetical protein
LGIRLALGAPQGAVTRIVMATEAAAVGGGIALIWAFVGAYLGGLFEKKSKTETIEHGTE